MIRSELAEKISLGIPTKFFRTIPSYCRLPPDCSCTCLVRASRDSEFLGLPVDVQIHYFAASEDSIIDELINLRMRLIGPEPHSIDNS
jgi:hypothetical protein